MFTKFVSLICILIEVNANQNLSDEFVLNLTPPTLTTQSFTDCFHCKSDSGPTNLTQLFTIYSKRENVSCNCIHFEHQALDFNITFRGSPDIIKTNKTVSYLISLNGNSIIWQRGKFEEGVCEGGYFEILKFFVASDHNGCSSNQGLDKMLTVHSTIDIEGGYCQAHCSGSSTIIFEPFIKNNLQSDLLN